MAINFPARFSGMVENFSGASVSLGRPIDLSDERSYSATGWFKVPAADGVSHIFLQQAGYTTVSVLDGVVSVTMGTTRIQTVPLRTDRWYQIGVVYSITNSSHATLTLYIDGVEAASTTNPRTSSPAQLSPLVIGNATCRRVSLWSVALTAEQVVQARFREPTGSEPNLAASFQFTRLPAGDVSGNSHPLTYLGGAQQRVTTPGVDTTGGSASFGSLDGFDASSQDWTVQTWARLGESQTGKAQTVAALGDASRSVSLRYDPSSASSAGLTVQVSGGDAVGAIVAPDTLGWTNLAVTYVAASQTAAIFVNGVQVTAGALALPAGLAGVLTVGADPTGSGGAFHGLIQSTVLWGRALSEGEIQLRQYPDPIPDAVPLAFLDLTADPPTELVAGEPITLSGARASSTTYSGVSIRGQRPTEVEAERVARRVNQDAAFDTLMAGYRPTARRIDPAHFDASRVEALAGPLLERLAGQVDAEQLRSLRETFHGALRDGLASARAGTLSQSGTFKTEVHDGVSMTFFFEAGTHGRVVQRHAAKLDPCTSWQIDVVATALFGLLDIIGVPVSAKVVSKSITRLLGKSKFARAIAEVLAAEFTADTIVAMVKALSDVDYLDTFVEDVLSHLSWWDFAWMVVELLIELLALIVPGAEIAVLIAKLALLVVQMAVLISEQPPNCPV